MSATIPNLSEIATWFNASLYITTFRPVEVKEYIKFGPDIIASDGIQVIRRLKQDVKVPGDRLTLYPLLSETISAGGSVLVFCQSKFICE